MCNLKNSSNIAFLALHDWRVPYLEIPYHPWLLVSLLAITIDQIRPPIIVQNRRNKHTFNTYAFTIDLFPLVFEKTCFAGHIFGIKWKTNKIKQKTQSITRISEMCKGKEWKRPIQTSKLGRIPPWQASRPSQQPTRARRWLAGPAQVRAYHSITVSRAHLALAVACRHAMTFPVVT
jgi:hypothetical protein